MQSALISDCLLGRQRNRIDISFLEQPDNFIRYAIQAEGADRHPAVFIHNGPA